jgi:biofilm PGA synthesis N-glycosyltransferase PgaC
MRNYRNHYVSVNQKFLISIAVAVLWATFSLWVARFWFDDLSGLIGGVLAGYFILFIAIIPGFINAFMFSSLMLDRRPERIHLKRYPGLSILVACYNEEKSIQATILSIYKQRYPGPLEVIAINDGSTDQTLPILRKLSRKFSWMKVVLVKKNQGKALCLNQGLKISKYSLIVTMDGDSFLFKEALSRIVERYKSDPVHTRAVAGTVMVRNSRDNWITQSQEWDYFHGIATVKRVQSLYQGTLVAQGAFSLYNKKALQEINGWPDTIGEDIVVTWALLEKSYRVGYCEDGIVFTEAPNTLLSFIKQRQRWAQGMFEAFQYHPKILFKKKLHSFFIWWDLLFPFMDFAFTFGFIPGLIAACLGHFWIVGPMTLSLFPIALFVNWLMYHIEGKMFNLQKLIVRRNILGFFIYIFPYNLILQPAAVAGYVYQIFGLKKTWGTK